MATFLHDLIAALNPDASQSGQAWFDRVRFHEEVTQVRRAFGGNITLRLMPSAPTGRWDSYGVVFTYDHFTITGRFDSEHPFKPPRFQVTPAPESMHYYNDGRGLHLCYTRPAEWQPGFTMATAIGEVIRFLAEYEKGGGR